MPARRRSVRLQRPDLRLSDTPVTGHVPSAALFRDADGRYCVSELQQPPKLPVKVLNYDVCEPSQTAADGASQKDVPAQTGTSRAAEGEEGDTAQARQRKEEDRTSLSRRGAVKTSSVTPGDKGEVPVSTDSAVTRKSTPNDSASSGSSARRLTLALSSPESSPAPSPARSNSPKPSCSSSPALKRPCGTTGRPRGTRPQPGLFNPGTPARLSVVTGSSLTPGAFDSDEDDIFECELRSKIGDVITLLRGDTNLSANGDGGVDGAGNGSGSGGGGSGGGSGGVGAGSDEGSGFIGGDGVLDARNDGLPGSKRHWDFEHVAEASGDNAKGDENGDANGLLPADAPPCRLPAARVTADNSLAALARHVVGRRPGERVVSELAELARSPGSPLLRQAGRKKARAARTNGRTTTPCGRGARETRAVVNGEETPATVKRRIGDARSPRRPMGDARSPRRQVGDARSPLVEKRTNDVGANSPVLGRSQTGSGKTRGWIMSPESGVLRKRSDLDASGDGKSSTDTGATSPNSTEGKVQRSDIVRTTEASPRLVKSPLKHSLSDRENISPFAVRTSPRLVSRDGPRHLSVPAAGCSAEGATGDAQRHPSVPAGGGSTEGAAKEQEEEEDIACTQPVTGLVLDGVVAIVDVRSGADNRSEPVRAQLRTLGALVLDRFTKQVTHVVFKDGSKATYDRARRSRLRLVSALWVDACRQQRERADENLFPPAAADRYESPLFPARLRKLRSMQPRDFEEELAAADRRFRRRRQQQRRHPPAVTAPIQRPAMTSPKRWLRRGTVEQLLTPRGQTRSGSTETGSSEDDLPLNVRLFNRFMSPAGGWSTGGALRRPASPTAKLAAQVSASPDLEANQRRGNKTGSSYTTGADQSAAGRNDAPPQRGSKVTATKHSTSAENPVSKPSTSAATNPNPKPTVPTAKRKRSLHLLTDYDSDCELNSAAAVSAPPAHRRRRRRLMTPPESQSLLCGPLLQPVTPAPDEQRRRPVAVVHPALRPPPPGRKVRTAPRGGGGGGGVGGGGGGGDSGGGGGSVRRLPAPRRSSLDFERAKPRPPPARGRLVLTNLRSVERETLLPVIVKLGDVVIVEEVTADTTHVISGQARRTVGVLGALTVGAWLLPPDWVLASLEAGRWLPEATFEQSSEWPAAVERRSVRGTLSLAPAAAVDDTGLTETTFGGTGGTATATATEANGRDSQRGATSSHKFAPAFAAASSSGVRPGLALFAAVGPVFISGDTRPPPAVLAGLVRLAGGVVVASARGASVAVGRPCRGVETVTEQWLMDSLQMNRLLVRQRYLQRQGAGKE